MEPTNDFGKWIPIPQIFCSDPQLNSNDVLLLGYLMQQANYHLHDEGEEWFFRTRSKIQNDIGLSFDQQKRSTNKLVARQLISRSNTDHYTKRVLKINWEEVNELFEELSREAKKPYGQKTRMGENQPTVWAETNRPYGSKPTDCMGENQPHNRKSKRKKKKPTEYASGKAAHGFDGGFTERNKVWSKKFKEVCELYKIPPPNDWEKVWPKEFKRFMQRNDYSPLLVEAVINSHCEKLMRKENNYPHKGLTPSNFCHNFKKALALNDTSRRNRQVSARSELLMT